MNVQHKAHLTQVHNEDSGNQFKESGASLKKWFAPKMGVQAPHSDAKAAQNVMEL